MSCLLKRKQNMAWSDLPVDLLYCIASRLFVVDIIRFSVVCTSWKSAISNNALLGFQCRPSPWLLLPSDAGEASDTLTFHDLIIEEEGGVGCHYNFSSIDGHIFSRRCIGSKDGWLVTLDKIDLQPPISSKDGWFATLEKTYLQPRIFNPITKVELSLPSLFTIPEDQWHRIKPEYAPDGSIEFFCEEIHSIFCTEAEMFRDVYYTKIVLSSNNLFGTAVVIYGYIKSLALARPGDQAWILGPQQPPYPDTNVAFDDFEDVYYLEEEQRFYAITHFSRVLAFDVNGQNVEMICPPILDNHALDFSYRTYIAFLWRNILKVVRMIETIDMPDDKDTAKTTKISVLKLVSDVNASSCSFSQWIHATDLGGFSLFIGYNQTFLLHHMDSPGIKPNCVYFTDQYHSSLPSGEGERDFGLFDIHNDCFQYFSNFQSQFSWPPTIWFMPSLS